MLIDLRLKERAVAETMADRQGVPWLKGNWIQRPYGDVSRPAPIV